MKPSSQQQNEESEKQNFDAALDQAGEEPSEELKAEESAPLLQTTDEDTDHAHRFEGGDEVQLTRAQLKEQKYKDQADAELQNKKFGEGDDESPFAMPKDRGCVDCWCLIILFAFIGVMGYVTIYGFQNGDVAKLTAPLDAANNFCGVDEYAEYPYLYLTKANEPDIGAIFNTGVCVSKCPDTEAEAQVLDCKPNDVVATCSVAEEFRYASKPYIEFCLFKDWDAAPEPFKQAWTIAKEEFAETGVGSYFVDCFQAKKAIMTSLFTCLLLCMAYVMLMSYASEILAWICIFLTWVGLIGLTAGCWILRTGVLEQIATMQDPGNSLTSDPEALAALEKEAANYMTGVVASGIVAALYTCCVWCYWSDLQTAIDVIDASADFLADTYRIIFTPIFHFLLQLIVLIVWVGAMACVVSMNDIKANPNIPQMKNLTWKDDVWYMSAFMFFGLLWLLALVDYINRFIVICSACTYYFNNKRNLRLSDGSSLDQVPASVCRAWHIAYVNHLGSIAVGAFVIAVIRFLKYTVVIMAQKIEQASAGSSAGAVVACFFKCATWFLELLETIADYINESAYCYIAVTGDNFCTGALQALLLKVKYMAMVAFATFLAKIFIFIGKVAIIVGNVFLFKLVMNKVTKEGENVSSEIGPMIVVGVISYLFVGMFIGMFDESVNAMLTCVAIDSNAHNGEPQYGPETFKSRLEYGDDGQMSLKKSRPEAKAAGNDMV